MFEFDPDQPMDVPTITAFCAIVAKTFEKHADAIDATIVLNEMRPSEFFAGLFEKTANEMGQRVEEHLRGQSERWHAFDAFDYPEPPQVLDTLQRDFLAAQEAWDDEQMLRSSSDKAQETRATDVKEWDGINDSFALDEWEREARGW